MDIDRKDEMFTRGQAVRFIVCCVVLFLVFCAALGLVGCGGNTDPVPGAYPFEGYYFSGRQTCSEYRVAFDSRQEFFQDLVPDDDMVLIRNAFDEALEQWNSRLEGVQLVEVEDDNCILADIPTRYRDDIQASSGISYPSVSPCRCVVGIYLSGDNGYLDAKNWRTVAHEIGHCMGLGHSSNPKNIMFFNYSTTAEILQENLSFIEENLVDGLVGAQFVNNPKCPNWVPLDQR